MQLDVLVPVDMVELEAGRAKRLELRANLPRRLTPDVREEEAPQPGPNDVAVELAVTADEPRDCARRRYRAPVDEDEMKSDAQVGQAAGTRYGVGRGRRPDHQARGRQYAAPMRLLDRLVDGDVEPEIVGADNEPPQPAISRWRRN